MMREPASSRPAGGHRAGTSLLTVEGVVLTPGGAPIDDTVRAGEIVGLAGLDSHGQEAFLETLAGLHRPLAGRVLAARPGGAPPVSVASFRQAVRHGIAYLPRDRRTTGIFPSLSVADNFALASLRRDCRFGLIGMGRRRQRYEMFRQRLSIVAPSPDAPITALSGGNQQKVLLARWLAREPRVLLLNDPTRGVDLPTREALYGVFTQLAREEGMALIVLSTEIEEILAVCDRAVVFREKQVAARLAGPAMTNDAVIAAMFGRAA